ncbi:MAG: hypothetical protein J6N45_06560 [Alphaproteobacteria bacterium]|nr:hypothetical protein [Alphaproteobacteria bacterium]
MKYIILTLFLAIFPAVAMADCWQIQNNDAQKMCLAKTKNDAGYCWQINNRDEQNYCLAVVKSDKGYCWQIQNRDKQQECLAMF